MFKKPTTCVREPAAPENRGRRGRRDQAGCAIHRWPRARLLRGWWSAPQKLMFGTWTTLVGAQGDPPSSRASRSLDSRPPVRARARASNGLQAPAPPGCRPLLDARHSQRLLYQSMLVAVCSRHSFTLARAPASGRHLDWHARAGPATALAYYPCPPHRSISRPRACQSPPKPPRPAFRPVPPKPSWGSHPRPPRRRAAASRCPSHSASLTPPATRGALPPGAPRAPATPPPLLIPLLACRPSMQVCRLCALPPTLRDSLKNPSH